MRLGFDLDGTVADLHGALALEARRLFPGVDPASLPQSATPGDAKPDGSSQERESLSSRALSARQQRELWKAVCARENFWESLDEIEPGALARLFRLVQDRRWEVIFLTSRPETQGDRAQMQSHRWLVARGFLSPSIFVVDGSRGRIAAALQLDVLVDDRPENCLDVAIDSSARALLVWRGREDQVPGSARQLGIGAVGSIGECLDILEQLDAAGSDRPDIVDRLKGLLGLKRRTTAMAATTPPGTPDGRRPRERRRRRRSLDVRLDLSAAHPLERATAASAPIIPAASHPAASAPPNRSLRIGIDATCWANDRGYGRFTREIVSAMVSIAPHHEFWCFVDERSAARFELSGAKIHRVVVPQSLAPTIAAVSGRRRSVRDMLRLTNAVRRAGVDVFFSPTVYGFFPLPPGLPAVVTVHDAIAERFPELALPLRRDRLFWRAKVWLALRQARLVLTVSDYAARDVVRCLGIPPERVRVALEGVAAAYRPSESQNQIREAARRAGLPDDARWLTYVGCFGAHKHVDVLVRAHAQVARRQSQPLALLLIGSTRDGFSQDLAGIHEAIRSCGTEHLVRWLGFVPDEELRHLHSGALALVLPSASEGFGLPAVEAARCGTPVVATAESPLPQLLDGGGIFVEPGNLDALVAALDRILSFDAPRQAMGRRALERSAALSWSHGARAALDALEEAAAP